MRIFIGTILMTTALSVHVANAAATIPDYQQPRPGKMASAAADPRDARAAMPAAPPVTVPSHFYETPSRR